jgi:hypothetical protein
MVRQRLVNGTEIITAAIKKKKEFKKRKTAFFQAVFLFAHFP